MSLIISRNSLVVRVQYALRRKNLRLQGLFVVESVVVSSRLKLRQRGSKVRAKSRTTHIITAPENAGMFHAPRFLALPTQNSMNKSNENFLNSRSTQISDRGHSR